MTKKNIFLHKQIYQIDVATVSLSNILIGLFFFSCVKFQLLEENDWVSIDLFLPFGSMATTAATRTATTITARATITSTITSTVAATHYTTVYDGYPKWKSR